MTWPQLRNTRETLSVSARPSIGAVETLKHLKHPIRARAREYERFINTHISLARIYIFTCFRCFSVSEIEFKGNFAKHSVFHPAFACFRLD